MSAPQISTYAEFWPYYLREHSKPETRAIHYFGTGLATLLLVAAIARGRPLLFLVALIAGYAPAWFAHFVVEKNTPATFTYPLWSLFSDYRMASTWLTGELGAELDKAGVTER